jgi:hypothetical protein
MIRKIFFTGVAIAAAYVLVSTLPDVARYIKMREM